MIGMQYAWSLIDILIDCCTCGVCEEACPSSTPLWGTNRAIFSMVGDVYGVANLTCSMKYRILVWKNFVIETMLFWILLDPRIWKPFGLVGVSNFLTTFNQWPCLAFLQPFAVLCYVLKHDRNSTHVIVYRFTDILLHLRGLQRTLP